MSTNYGDDRNEWLVDLSYSVSATLAILFAVGVVALIHRPILQLMGVILRPLAPLITWLKYAIAFTPLRTPLRRYLYTGRHLQEA